MNFNWASKYQYLSGKTSSVKCLKCYMITETGRYSILYLICVYYVRILQVIMIHKLHFYLKLSSLHALCV